MRSCEAKPGTTIQSLMLGCRCVPIRPIISRVFRSVFHSVFLCCIPVLRQYFVQNTDVFQSLEIPSAASFLFFRRGPPSTSRIGEDPGHTSTAHLDWLRPHLRRQHLVIYRNSPHATSMNFSDRVVRLLSPHRDPPAAAPGALTVPHITTAERVAVPLLLLVHVLLVDVLLRRVWKEDWRVPCGDFLTLQRRRIQQPGR